jgi:hypothetical protein
MNKFHGYKVLGVYCVHFQNLFLNSPFDPKADCSAWVGYASTYSLDILIHLFHWYVLAVTENEMINATKEWVVVALADPKIPLLFYKWLA